MRSWNNTRSKILTRLKREKFDIQRNLRRSLIAKRESRHAVRRRSAIAILSLYVFFLFPQREARAQLPGVWQQRASMPSARTEVTAVQLDGKIYVMGGYEKGGDLVEEYDPKKNSWRRRAALPKALHHIGAAAINGKIYVIGGYISGVGPVATVYEYDAAADRWRSRQSMPTPRGALAVGVIEGKIFAIGGVGANGKNTNVNEEYDPAQDRWTKRAPLPTPRDHHAIGVVNGKLYAIGGRINGRHDRSIADNEAVEAFQKGRFTGPP